MDNYYRAKGTEIGALVDRKNKQYGNSFNRAGDILTILYPDGVTPDQYRDMLAVVRVLDKLFRVAHGKQGSEDPWQDIAGYGLWGWVIRKSAIVAIACFTMTTRIIAAFAYGVILQDTKAGNN